MIWLPLNAVNVLGQDNFILHDLNTLILNPRVMHPILTGGGRTFRRPSYLTFQLIHFLPRRDSVAEC